VPCTFREIFQLFRLIPVIQPKARTEMGATRRRCPAVVPFDPIGHHSEISRHAFQKTNAPINGAFVQRAPE